MKKNKKTHVSSVLEACWTFDITSKWLVLRPVSCIGHMTTPHHLNTHTSPDRPTWSMQCSGQDTLVVFPEHVSRMGDWSCYGNWDETCRWQHIVSNYAMHSSLAQL